MTTFSQSSKRIIFGSCDFYNCSSQSPPPPPDLVSLTSYDEGSQKTRDDDDDNDDELNSLSTSLSQSFKNNDDIANYPSRSMFQSYWDKHGSKPMKPLSRDNDVEQRMMLRKKKLPPIPPFLPEEWGLNNEAENHIRQRCNGNDCHDHHFTYESTLNEQEGFNVSTDNRRRNNNPTRRSIFGFTSAPSLRHSRSEKSLLTGNDVSSSPCPSSTWDLRKVSSSSELLHNRRKENLVSCLRSPSSSPRRQNQPSENVSWSPKVSVIVYDKPMIRHSEEGWSKWFH